MARNTAAEMPPRSVLSSTRCTRTAPNAVSMRWIMLAFSAVGNTEACVTRRRMSRPESGFATTPTIASPMPHLLAPLCAPTGQKGKSRRACAVRSLGCGLPAGAVAGIRLGHDHRLDGHRGDGGIEFGGLGD